MMGEINFSPMFKENFMVKMESPNRKGTWKEFKDADVESAKANGWVEVDKPKAKTPTKSKEKK